MRELIDQHEWDAPANRCLLQAEASEGSRVGSARKSEPVQGSVSVRLSVILHGNAGCGSHATLTTSSLLSALVALRQVILER